MIQHRLFFIFFITGLVYAQGPQYKFGTPPTDAELLEANSLIDQDGVLLPEGHGTVIQGAELYQQRCAMCHGTNGEGTASPAGVGPVLIANGSRQGVRHLHFSTTLFSFIRRAMPMHQERTLGVNESYALTAFLLYRNGIIKENDVMDEKTLPQVEMPNRGDWTPPYETSG
jgi:cytochrome c